MAKLLIETDALQNASNNIITYSKELTNIADSVNGYSTDADEFDFSGAKGKIAENLNRMNIRVTNIAQVFAYTADSHTDIQNSLSCDASDNLNTKTTTGQSNQTSSSSANQTTNYGGSSGGTGGGYSGGGGYSPSYEQPSQNTEPPKTESKFVPYFQENYNDAYVDGKTIAAAGAAPTAIAMVLSALKGKEVSPTETAKWSIDNGFAGNELTDEKSFIDAISKAYGVDCKELALSEENILSNIKDGKYMIASMKEGQLGDGSNYVVITGITEDGKIKIADPTSKENTEKTWDLSVFLNEGNKLWVF